MDDALKKEVDALRGDLKKIKDDLVGLTKTITQLTKSEAAEGLKDIKQTGEQVEARLRKAADEAKTTLEQQVRDRPLGTLLLAFTVGLLFGKAASR
jgi:ElaB/YqjD/DUF883 family membrane-anchored ribosome-binding protein